ncbi:glutaredoxin domain-containing protein [Modestobacter sp. DSM 44400]|uniref:glutaredoxin family protein n=1 Tax=Modestobacter sp. DSM 44400 TaxID=1550230 RepID=UPI000B82E73E
MTVPEAVVTVYTRPGCPFSAALRWQLRRLAVQVREIDIWADRDAAGVVRVITGGDETVPTVVVGTRTMVSPGVDAVRAALAEVAPEGENRGGAVHGGASGALDGRAGTDARGLDGGRSAQRGHGIPPRAVVGGCVLGRHGPNGRRPRTRVCARRHPGRGRGGTLHRRGRCRARCHRRRPQRSSKPGCRSCV